MRDASEILGDERHVASLQGDVGPRAQRDPHIGSRERGSVVQPVPHERDDLPGFAAALLGDVPEPVASFLHGADRSNAHLWCPVDVEVAPHLCARKFNAEPRSNTDANSDSAIGPSPSSWNILSPQPRTR